MRWRRCGRMARLLTQDWVLRAQRVVLGVTERMPEIGGSFFESVL